MPAKANTMGAKKASAKPKGFASAKRAAPVKPDGSPEKIMRLLAAVPAPQTVQALSPVKQELEVDERCPATPIIPPSQPRCSTPQQPAAGQGDSQAPAAGSGGSSQAPAAGSGGSSQAPAAGSGGSSQAPAAGSGGNSQAPAAGSGGNEKLDRGEQHRFHSWLASRGGRKAEYLQLPQHGKREVQIKWKMDKQGADNTIQLHLSKTQEVANRRRTS